ncbi:type IV pilus modification protein PilV [Glaciecola sp. 1036]|uniref:type IV pilus modification protein PilV n=1 Tax=Alteromonadaceae TaxID=72275 RepID=UPI003D02AC8D
MKIAKRKLVQHQKGITMIEVLVTLFVLSIGLLGVVSMQFIGSFSNKNAMSRTQAVMVTQQMAERLRASVSASDVTDGFIVDNAYYNANNYNFNNLSCGSSASDYNCFCLSIPADVPNCLTGECSASDFAVFDAYQMSCATVASNPAATISVNCSDKDDTDADSCTAGSIQQIMVKWPAPSWQNQDRIANSACNSDGSDDYDCVVVEILL